MNDDKALLQRARCRHRSAAWNLRYHAKRAFYQSYFGKLWHGFDTSKLESQEIDSDHASHGPHFCLGAS